MQLFILDKDDRLVATLDNNSVESEACPLYSANTQEQLNDVSILSFETSAEHEQSVNIKEGYSTVFKDELLGYREYSILEVEDSDDGDLTKDVTATLSAVELDDEIILKETSASKDIGILLAEVLKDTRWSVGYIDSSITQRNVSDPMQYLSVLEGIFLLQSTFDCDVHFSYQAEGNRITKRSVSFYKRLDGNKGKRFEVGKDVESISRTVDISNLKTAIIPVHVTEENEQESTLSIKDLVWKESSGDPIDKPKGQIFLSDPEALKKWGRRDSSGTLRNRFIFMDIKSETAEELANLAWMQLARYTEPSCTYEAKVLDLYRLTGDSDLQHEQVVLGETCTVIDLNFSEPLQVISRVVELQKDLLQPEETSVVLGNSKGNYTTGRNGTLDYVEEVQGDLNNVALSANNKNKIFYGSNQPAGMNKNDLWFRPHPEKPDEQQMLRYDGTQWVIESDTSDLTSIKDEFDSFVPKDAVITTINEHPQLIEVINGDKLHISVETAIDKAVIRDAHIADISADKIRVGTLDAANLNVINLNASSITSGTLKAISITGSTITGGQLVSTAAINKVVIENGRINWYKTNESEPFASLVAGRVSDSANYIEMKLASQQTFRVESSVTGSSLMSFRTKTIGSDTSYDAITANAALNWITPVSAVSATKTEYSTLSLTSLSSSMRVNGANGGYSSIQLGTATANLYARANSTARQASFYLSSTLAQLYTDSFGVYGNFNVTGSKNAIHVTRDGVRSTPAYETAESYLGDLGKAITDQQCLAVIPIETLFSDTVNTAIDYHVFLSNYTNSTVWVAEQTEAFFVVQSDQPLAEFSWEIKAKRKGYEADRMEIQSNFDNQMIEKVFKQEG